MSNLILISVLLLAREIPATEGASLRSDIPQLISRIANTDPAAHDQRIHRLGRGTCPRCAPATVLFAAKTAGTSPSSQPVNIPSVNVQTGSIVRADELFAARDNAESLKQAVTLMEQLTAKEPSNYEAWWRLARLRYYLGDREKDQAKKTKLFLAGVGAAKKAVALDDKRVEGHFWFGANEGEYADLKGALQSLGLVKTIRKEFESALAINPAYENGAIHSALGQIDLNLPRLLGGNERRGIERLEEGLKVGPNNAELKVTLAEVHEKKGRSGEARKLLESVLAVNDPARTPLELEELRSKARRLLDKLK